MDTAARTAARSRVSVDPQAERERAYLAEFLDLIIEDNRVNVYAGELEVRHQVRPPLNRIQWLGAQLLVDTG